MSEGGKVLENDRGVGADVIEPAEMGERAGDVAAHQIIEEVDDQTAVGEAEHRPDRLGLDRAGRMGDGLIEERERIARRTFRRAGKH